MKASRIGASDEQAFEAVAFEMRDGRWLQRHAFSAVLAIKVKMARRLLIPFALMLCVVGLAAALLTIATREDGAGSVQASHVRADHE